jgi:REP element-mobilizing transposase RayT
MNRGIARRTVFERPADRDRFLSLLAEEVEARRIEIHCYCLMTTHFHLLVRSPTGEISEAMRRVLNGYVRSFNRARRRDGALFRGRFRSRLVQSASHWIAVLWYIDRNPVAAGLVARSTDWPHGSAHWYSRHGGPPWLTRSVVEGMLRAERPGYEPSAYPARVGGGDLAWVDEVVERRLLRRGFGPDPLDDLVRASPAEVQSWMAMKADRADGSGPGLVLASEGGILRAAGVDPGRLGDDGTDPAASATAVALLRLACGLKLEEIAAVAGRSTTWVRARLGEHGRLASSDSGYSRAAAAALARALREEAGSLGDPRVIPIVSPAGADLPGTARFPRSRASDSPIASLRG